MKNTGLFIMVLVFVFLFIASIVVNLTLLKKYKDIIDYFNQDSQLTMERVGNVEDRVNSVKAALDALAPRFKILEDGMKVLEGSINSNAAKQNEIKKELLSQIQIINNDLLAVKASIRLKEEAPAEEGAAKSTPATEKTAPATR